MSLMYSFIIVSIFSSLSYMRMCIQVLFLSSTYYHKTVRSYSQLSANQTSKGNPLSLQKQKNTRLLPTKKSKEKKNSLSRQLSSQDNTIVFVLVTSFGRRTRASLYHVAMATADPKTTQAECTFLVLA